LIKKSYIIKIKANVSNINSINQQIIEIPIENEVTSNIGYYENNNESYILLFYWDKSYKYIISSWEIINLWQKIKNISYVNTNDSIFFPVDRWNNKIEVVIFDKKILSSTSYSSCDKPNIKIWGQEFSSCDIVISSGGGSWWGWWWGGGTQINPCQDGYSLPTQTQINNMIAIGGGTTSDYQNKCFKIETSPSSTSSSIEQTANTQELINWTCWTDNTKILETRPYNYCSTGFLGEIFVNESGYSWSCNWKNGGTSQECSSQKKVDALCGTDNKKILTSRPTNYCSKWTFSSITYEQSSNSWIWWCNGVNEWNSATCYSKKNDLNWVCGSSNNLSFESAPITGLCSSWTPSVINSSWNNYSWTCNWLESNQSCSANKITTNGVCWPAVNSEPVYSFSFLQSSLCLKWTYENLQNNSNSFSYTCLGLNNGSNRTCIIPKKVDGVCGASRNGTSFYAPITNLCLKWEASSVLWNWPFYWTCNGENNWEIANCFSDKSLAPNYTITGKITNYWSSYGREWVTVNICWKQISTNFLWEYSVEIQGWTSCSNSSIVTSWAVCSFSSIIPNTINSNSTFNWTCQTRYTFDFWTSSSGATIKWCSSSSASQRIIQLNSSGVGYWTQEGSSCSDSNYMTIAKTDAICQKNSFNSSTNTYLWTCRVLNNYIIEGAISFIDNTGGGNTDPTWKNIYVCWNTISLNSSGNYSKSVKEGTNCSTIYLNESNYSCEFTGDKTNSINMNSVINGVCTYIPPNNNSSSTTTDEQKCYNKGWNRQMNYMFWTYNCAYPNYWDSYSCQYDYNWICQDGSCEFIWEYDAMMGSYCQMNFVEPPAPVKYYNVSGNVWTEAYWATISLCGYSVPLYSTTVSSDWSFNLTVPEGMNCAYSSLTKSNYNCSISQCGPSYLTSNYSSISGSCTEKKWYSVSIDLGLEGSWASVYVCWQGYYTLDSVGKYSFNVLEGTNCQNGGLTVSKPNYKIENLTNLSSLPTNISSNISITGSARLLNSFNISGNIQNWSWWTLTLYGKTVNINEDGSYSVNWILEDSTSTINSSTAYINKNWFTCSFDSYGNIPSKITQSVINVNWNCNLIQEKILEGYINNYYPSDLDVSICWKTPYERVLVGSSGLWSVYFSLTLTDSEFNNCTYADAYDTFGNYKTDVSVDMYKSSSYPYNYIIDINQSGGGWCYYWREPECQYGGGWMCYYGWEPGCYGWYFGP